MAWVFSTPNGVDPDNFFYAICNEQEYGFKEFRSPSVANPYVPPEEIEEERLRQHPSVFQQEYLAEFVDWRSVSLLSVDKLLVNELPVDYPVQCETVYAVIDSAMKEGKNFDGTAVVYVAKSSLTPHKLTILDWDIVSIDAAMLEHWIPSVYARLEDLAKRCRARYGSAGIWVEPKGSGIILLQQGRNKGWKMHEIESDFVQQGKDARAVSISGYHHQELIKISEHAYDKVVSFKGATRNHLVSEMSNFRLGDPDIGKKSNDLLDSYVYAVAIGVGNKYGF
jgi:hypothetical protein